jgi:hypothetical protein
MSNLEREEQIRAHTERAAQRLMRAGENLALRQITGGAQRGNVPPWPGSDDPDFHGTLAAIWLWSRAHALANDDAFVPHVSAAWGFVQNAWPRFVPKALGDGTTDEAAYDCALVLRAALADSARNPRSDALALAETAARLIAVYLSDLDDFRGREFRDPGFLAWTLAEFARAREDRGLAATARRFVERAFGMKAPPPFASEPAAGDGLFDFSSTTATRVLAVLATEGATPFVGAWLRERVAPHAPRGLLARALDENCWNACVATALGRGYLVATDPALFAAHQRMLSELDDRAGDGVAMGRAQGFSDETQAAFYYGLALDALVRE